MYQTLLVAGSDPARARELVAARRRATVLLAAVAVGFVVVTMAGGDAAWAAWVRAGAETSLVGGLADWFASDRAAVTTTAGRLA